MISSSISYVFCPSSGSGTILQVLHISSTFCSCVHPSHSTSTPALHRIAFGRPPQHSKTAAAKPPSPLLTRTTTRLRTDKLLRKQSSLGLGGPENATGRSLADVPVDEGGGWVLKDLEGRRWNNNDEPLFGNGGGDDGPRAGRTEPNREDRAQPQNGLDDRTVSFSFVSVEEPGRAEPGAEPGAQPGAEPEEPGVFDRPAGGPLRAPRKVQKVQQPRTSPHRPGKLGKGDSTVSVRSAMSIEPPEGPDDIGPGPPE